MRELIVKLRFVSPCLGRIKKYRRSHGKAQECFVLPRDPISNKVVFQQSWWQSILLKASEVLCRHQQEIQKIRFMMEIEGSPRQIPEGFYKRHAGPRAFTKHEAFLAGDVISVKCIVPSTISDEDFIQLMRYAGRYYGISPAYPGEFGFYEVVSTDDQRIGEAEHAQNEGSCQGAQSADAGTAI
jgi:hypothetical protein